MRGRKRGRERERRVIKKRREGLQFFPVSLLTISHSKISYSRKLALIPPLSLWYNKVFRAGRKILTTYIVSAYVGFSSGDVGPFLDISL